MKTETFTFSLWYFKPNGKYYTETVVNWKVRCCDVAPDATRLAYMSDACAKLRGLRDNGGPGALPGLSGDSWDGFILINSEEGFPCLIIPKEKNHAVSAGKSA